MKRFLVCLFCFGLTVNFAFSQENIPIKDQIEKDGIMYKNYMDPTFPDVAKITSTQDPAMADYAKQHPPIPLKKNTGNEPYDQETWQSKVSIWFTYNPYFPQFIEYHKFNYLLTADDDLKFYNTAKTEWIKRHPEVKTSEIKTKISNN